MPKPPPRPSLERTVLVVDDAKSIFTAALQRERFVVLDTVTDLDGLAVAGALRPDLILVRIRSLAGAQDFLSRCRATPALRDVPVVAVSDELSPGDVTALLAAGYDRVLTEPVAPASVVLAVREELGYGRIG